MVVFSQHPRTLCKSTARVLGIQPIEAEYILGPFSSGKTVLVSKLYELQRLRMPESKTFAAAGSNNACDAVVPKFASSGLMVVRAHALSLERKTLLKPYFKARRCGKLAEVDPLSEIMNHHNRLKQHQSNERSKMMKQK